MGANGSRAKGTLETEEGREYKTLFKVVVKGNVIVYLDQKNPKQSGQTPEESHTPNRIYVSVLKKNGRPLTGDHALTPHMKKILKIVQNYGNYGNKS